MDLIRQSTDGISRAQIAQAIGVSRSTVSAIVDELMLGGLVLERGVGVSRGGRRPIVLEINPQAGRVVGVDLGATHASLVVADMQGRMLAEGEAPLDITAGPERCFDRVDELLQACLRDAGDDLANVRAMGVGVPGPVIAADGIVSAPPIMPGWDAYPIRQHLGDRWHKPVSLNNDADLGALGEWTFGAGRGVSHLAYIKIATGIGSGLLLNGHIYRGVRGTAGEIGHVTIHEDGPPCSCGNYGCLEAMAGGRAIGQRATLVVAAGQRTMLANINHGREITARDVAEAARRGDLVSQQLLNDAGKHIGSALSSLINLLNPELVLLGGGVTGAGDFLLNPIRQAVRERTMSASLQATRIELAALGRRSSALGAAALALNHAIRQMLGTGRARAARAG